jgi:hypothetical protein
MQNQEMTKKKENLTYVEAVKIYAESQTTGAKIKDRTGWTYWIEDGEACTGYWVFDKGRKGKFPNMDNAPFTLVPAPRKQPTLNECLRAKRVKVKPPEGVSTLWDEFVRPCGGHWRLQAYGDQWRLQDVSFIQAALSAGWDVEIVEDKA